MRLVLILSAAAIGFVLSSCGGLQAEQDATTRSTDPLVSYQETALPLSSELGDALWDADYLGWRAVEKVRTEVLRKVSHLQRSVTSEKDLTNATPETRSAYRNTRQGLRRFRAGLKRVRAPLVWYAELDRLVNSGAGPDQLGPAIRDANNAVSYLRIADGDLSAFLFSMADAQEDIRRALDLVNEDHGDRESALKAVEEDLVSSGAFAGIVDLRRAIKAEIQEAYQSAVPLD